MYIESVLEEDDPALLLVALRNVADSQGGVAMMAEHSGLSRESLYRTLSKKGNPKISTLMLIMKAFGFCIYLLRWLDLSFYSDPKYY